MNYEERVLAKKVRQFMGTSSWAKPVDTPQGEEPLIDLHGAEFLADAMLAIRALSTQLQVPILVVADDAGGMKTSPWIIIIGDPADPMQEFSGDQLGPLLAEALVTAGAMRQSISDEATALLRELDKGLYKLQDIAFQSRASDKIGELIAELRQQIQDAV